MHLLNWTYECSIGDGCLLAMGCSMPVIVVKCTCGCTCRVVPTEPPDAQGNYKDIQCPFCSTSIRVQDLPAKPSSLHLT
jgi:hypothetical protein